jgi:hypothetical protein
VLVCCTTVQFAHAKGDSNRIWQLLGLGGTYSPLNDSQDAKTKRRRHYRGFADGAVLGFEPGPIVLKPASVWHFSGNRKREGS